MQNRTKILIVIAVVIAGLLFAIGAGQYLTGDNGQTISFFSSTPVETDDSEAIDSAPVATLEISEPQQFSAAVVARLFTERFGTFSNQDDFAGIELVRPYITPSFSRWFDTGYKDQLAEKYSSTDYAGETVKVLDVIMESETNNSAVAAVRTQRTIRTQDGDKTSYQTLRLDMQKSEGVWLIDGAYWQNR